MITAVDSSVLVDVLVSDLKFGPASKEALQAARREGPLIACEVVWAEIGSIFPTRGAVDSALALLEVEFSAMEMAAALEAAAAWRLYRSKGGPRDRLVPDFLIGAHALVQADRLMTRDRGFYRKYFDKLKIIDPTSR